jgi:hypothetical protein
MTGKKNKGASGKTVAKRETPSTDTPRKAADADAPVERKRVPERIKENEPGFGVIKVAAGVIIALIVGVSILGKFYGGADADRGSSGQDERCANTQECKPGFICQAHGDDAERCLKLCQVQDPQSCDTGYKCVSSARAAGRRKVRVTAVCVPNAKAD